MSDIGNGSIIDTKIGIAIFIGHTDLEHAKGIFWYPKAGRHIEGELKDVNIRPDSEEFQKELLELIEKYEKRLLCSNCKQVHFSTGTAIKSTILECPACGHVEVWREGKKIYERCGE